MALWKWLLIGAGAWFMWQADARAACESGVEYQPDPGIAYQPGLDAQGGALPPADITPGAPVDIAIDMRQPLEAHVKKESYNADLSRMEIDLGRMEVKEQGAMGFPPIAKNPCH